MQSGEHRQPEFLAINPFGKVAAIVDGFRLWESRAILLYLAQEYNKIGSSVEQFAQTNQWIVFANATLATGIFGEANRERELPRLLFPLNQILKHQPFLLSDEFRVVDVAVGSTFGFMLIILKLDFSAYPAILTYSKQYRSALLLKMLWQYTLDI